MSDDFLAFDKSSPFSQKDKSARMENISSVRAFFCLKIITGRDYIAMKITRNRRTVTVDLSGEIDHHSIREIREEIDRTLERSGAVNVAFDLSNVSFMDSSGIGLILGRYKKVRAFGGQIIIIGASEAIKKLLKMSGVSDIVIMVETGSDITGVIK